MPNNYTRAGVILLIIGVISANLEFLTYWGLKGLIVWMIFPVMWVAYPFVVWYYEKVPLLLLFVFAGLGCCLLFLGVVKGVHSE